MQVLAEPGSERRAPRRDPPPRLAPFLSPVLSLSLSLSFSLTFSPSFSLSFSLSFALSFSPSFALSFSLSFPLSFSPSFSLSFSLSFSPSFALSFALAFCLSFSLLSPAGAHRLEAMRWRFEHRTGFCLLGVVSDVLTTSSSRGGGASSRGDAGRAKMNLHPRQARGRVRSPRRDPPPSSPCSPSPLLSLSPPLRWVRYVLSLICQRQAASAVFRATEHGGGVRSPRVMKGKARFVASCVKMRAPKAQSACLDVILGAAGASPVSAS